MKLSKEIIKGSLQLIILEILSDGDEYGYNCLLYTSLELCARFHEKEKSPRVLKPKRRN